MAVKRTALTVYCELGETLNCVNDAPSLDSLDRDHSSGLYPVYQRKVPLLGMTLRRSLDKYSIHKNT